MSTIALVGSGEFTPAMVQADRYLLSLLPPRPKVAVLPTAAGQERDYRKWINRGVKHFRNLGVDVYGVDIAKRTDTKKVEHLDRLESTDLIYFSGGNPGYLFDVINGSNLEELLRRRLKTKNFILAGASAGAMVLGQFIPANIFAMRVSSEKPRWQPALSLVPYTVIPHYDYVLREEKGLLERLMSNLPSAARANLLGIDEDTVLIIGSKKIMGRGRVHFL